jgi:hypothetical protein
MEVKEIERLIRISKERPLLPETFVPWHEKPKEDELFLPEWLNSLEGLEIYNTLSPQQKLELGRHEAVQVMYSYGWSEALFCLFMNRYILTLQPDHVEHRFLLRELIEEFRHQEMFAQGIIQLNGQPLKPTRMHNIVGQFTTKYMPHDIVFMSCLSVELIADMYGYQTRRDPKIYNVIRKISELHNIEEGRHIHFTKGLLKNYTQKAGYVKRTIYSYIILLNVYFMRTLYVKKEIFERIGMENPGAVYKLAFKNYKNKFAATCLETIIEFVNEWNGFNGATRWAWRLLLNAKI